MLKRYLEAGQICGTHGVKGEVRVNPWCDSPEFLKSFKKLYFDKNGERPFRAVSRVQGNIVLMKIDGTDTLEKAALLRNKIIYLDRNDAVISENSFFVQDLIDCKVYDIDSGAEYGVLCDVSRTGANDVWHIKKDKKETLIPAIPDVVIKTDVQNGEIYIRPLKGLFDDED